MTGRYPLSLTHGPPRLSNAPCDGRTIEAGDRDTSRCVGSRGPCRPRAGEFCNRPRRPESRQSKISSFNSGETRSSASMLNIQSFFASSIANCFCLANPGHARVITCSGSFAISRYGPSSESTQRISSAHSTERIAAAIFASSLNVMMTADIFTNRIFAELHQTESAASSAALFKTGY